MTAGGRRGSTAARTAGRCGACTTGGRRPARVPGAAGQERRAEQSHDRVESDRLANAHPRPDAASSHMTTLRSRRDTSGRTTGDSAATTAVLPCTDVPTRDVPGAPSSPPASTANSPGSDSFPTRLVAARGTRGWCVRRRSGTGSTVDRPPPGSGSARSEEGLGQWPVGAAPAHGPVEVIEVGGLLTGSSSRPTSRAPSNTPARGSQPRSAASRHSGDGGRRWGTRGMHGP